MAPTGDAYHVDWIVATVANVHVANHRDWFSTFTPFETSFNHPLMGGDPVKVLGVGEVVLPVKTQSRSSGSSTQSTIKLRQHGMKFAKSDGMMYELTTKKCIALVDNPYLYRLRLKGQSSTQTSLKPDVNYMIGSHWAEDERERFEAYQSRQERQSSSPETIDTVEQATAARYTAAEKEWMKQHYGGEFKFLRAYGLKIYDEEDREEGRQILRSMMAGD